MATTPSLLLQVLSLLSIIHLSFAGRRLTELVHDSSNLLHYHHGALLSGNISVNLIWYGRFSPSQKAVVSDFISSLSATTTTTKPSVATWWKTTEKYHTKTTSPPPSLRLGKQISDPNYSLGKSLTDQHLIRLASRGQPDHAVNVVLTASDVGVDGFCSSRCGSHGSSSSSLKPTFSKNALTKGKNDKNALKKGNNKNYKFAYIWVGNSETQCPGQCAWPFHQPIYGPQGAPLVAPNNDVGVDGMVINLGGLLAGTATNPFGDGYYQGDAGAPLEAGSACTGVYGKGAYPGYAGELLVDSTTGASYNAHGTNGRKYLLPALYDPSSSTCSTLV